ncbi:MAG: PspC domain-containing protein [Bacteroidia bacterium]
MKKILQRDQSNKVIGGVCGGLGNYFDSDPILFRAIFLLLLFVGGGGVLLYVILWAVLPQKSDLNTNYNHSSSQQTFTPPEEDKKQTGSESANIAVGLILLSAGILLLVNNLVPDFDFHKFWPVILIVVGGGLIFGHRKLNSTKENINESNNEEPK